MNTKAVFVALLMLCGALSLSAAEIVVVGPKGGRLLNTEPLKSEFFVNAARKVEIAFYNAALQPVAPGAQVVAVTAEPASGKTAMEMEETPRGFVSKTPLPAGEPYRVVVQLRDNAAAKPNNFRIDVSLEECGECHHAEYACTCVGH